MYAEKKGEKDLNYGKSLISVNSQNPCPICGKTDWCFWRPQNGNPDLYDLYCNRHVEAQGVVVYGNDGKEYISCRRKSGTPYYEDRKQRDARIRKWKKEYKEKVQAEASIPRTYTVLDSVEPLPNQELDRIYRCLLDHLPLLEYHYRYLLKEGWTNTLIKKINVRSFPVSSQYKLPLSARQKLDRQSLAKKVMANLQLTSLKGVPGAYIDETGNWNFNSKSGIILPVYDEEGYIYRLRLRMDFLDLPVKRILEDEDGFFYYDVETKIRLSMGGPYRIDEDGTRTPVVFKNVKGKYRIFSSFKEDPEAYKTGYIVNLYNKGCGSGNVLCYAIDGMDDMSVWWITEGEKKAFFSHHQLKQPFICIPGVNSYSLLNVKKKGITPLEMIRERGGKIIVIAYDADRFSNDAVMRYQEELAKMLKNHGFTVFIAIWPEDQGKGLDDMLHAGFKPSFYEWKE